MASTPPETEATATQPMHDPPISLAPQPRLQTTHLAIAQPKPPGGFDLSQTMAPLLSMVDVSHLLMGTDYPFARETSVRAAVEGIANLSLHERSVKMIQREKALFLFPRFA